MGNQTPNRLPDAVPNNSQDVAPRNSQESATNKSQEAALNSSQDSALNCSQDSAANNSKKSEPDNPQNSAPNSILWLNPIKMISDFITGWIANLETEPSDEEALALRANVDLEDRIFLLRFSLITSPGTVSFLRNKIMEQIEDQEFREYKQQMTSWFDEGDARHQRGDESRQKYVLRSIAEISKEFYHTNVKVERDVRVIVQGIDFCFNSQNLASKSAYFATELKSGKRMFTFQQVEPDIFLELFRYVFISKVEVVNMSRIYDLVKVAEDFIVPGMKKCLLSFIRRKELFVNAISDWEITKLSRTPLALYFYLKYLDNFSEKLRAYYAHKKLYESDFFGPDITESVVLGNLMQWCDSNYAFFKLGHDNYEMCDWVMATLLQCIRWTAVPWEVVEKCVEDNVIRIAGLDQVFEFFTTAFVEYYSYGIQYPLLRTFIRPSQGFERCLITVGGVDNSEIKAVCLQSPGCLEYDYLKETKVPLGTKIHESVSGQLYQDPDLGLEGWKQTALFVTGMGVHYNEIWKFRPSVGWRTCPNMVVSRKFYSSVFVGVILFSCGGLVGNNFDMATNSVEWYNTENIFGASILCQGTLTHSVRQATGVAHRDTIYLFGGYDNNPASSFSQIVQMYNTETEQCTVFDWSLHSNRITEFMVPTVLEDKIVLLGENDSFFVETKTLGQKLVTEYKTNIRQFAALVEDSSIFVFARPEADSAHAGRILRYRLTEDKYQVIKTNYDVPTEWETYGTMPFHSNVLVYGITSLPTR